jgi:hypothetical protein
MTTTTPVTTPIALSPDTGGEELLDASQTKRFRTLAGGLLWLARCTRQDIAFAVHQMTRRTHAPRLADLRLGKRVLRYLLGTATMKLHARQDARDTLVLSAYIDTDFAARHRTRNLSAQPPSTSMAPRPLVLHEPE